MKFLLRLIVVLMMVGSAYAQSNLPACPSSGYFHNCFGTFTQSNGDKYVGEFKDDKFNGQGTYTWINGSKYVGEFKDDKRNGQGTQTFANGNKYVGEWKDDNRNGQFTVTYANGHKYIGEIKDDKFNGQGTYTFANSNKYVGEFKDDKYNGQGIFYLANGSISQSGVWSDDKLITAQYVDPNRFTRIAKGNSAPSAAEAQQSNLPACPSSGYFHNCFGTFTFSNGDKYVGEWKDLKHNGQGTYTFANGDKYVGEFKDFNYNGQGILYLSNGSISQSGIWSDNRLVTADRTIRQEEVSQKKTDISIDDERLLKSYGTCDSILKATIFMLNRNGLQDNPLQGIATHQLTIYTILNLNIVRKYPESLHEKAFKIMIKFAEEKIKGKIPTGSQLNAFKIENGGCSLDEVPSEQIDKIMRTEKDSYDMLFKRFKKL